MNNPVGRIPLPSFPAVRVQPHRTSRQGVLVCAATDWGAAKAAEDSQSGPALQFRNKHFEERPPLVVLGTATGEKQVIARIFGGHVSVYRRITGVGHVGDNVFPRHPCLERLPCRRDKNPVTGILTCGNLAASVFLPKGIHIDMRNSNTWQCAVDLVKCRVGNIVAVTDQNHVWPEIPCGLDQSAVHQPRTNIAHKTQRGQVPRDVSFGKRHHPPVVANGTIIKALPRTFAHFPIAANLEIVDNQQPELHRAKSSVSESPTVPLPTDTASPRC